MNWAIGDIQGCFDSFMKLLDEVNFDESKDRLWLVGDLVNRCDKSLEVIEFLYSIKDSINIVLGNHDMRLIASHFGLKKGNSTINPILNSPKAEIYIDWLRTQPFLHYDKELNFVMVHAGIAPNFTLNDAIRYNNLLQSRLQNEEAKKWLKDILSIEVSHFDRDSLSEFEKEKFALNSFIRMRYCKGINELDFKQKGSPKKLKRSELKPWFECPKRELVEPILYLVTGLLLALFENREVDCHR